ADETTTFTGRRVLDLINGLSVGPNDVIFVYISTHGAFTAQGHGMAAFGPNHQIDLKRNDIIASLEQKGRLRILITDSCGTSLNPVLQWSFAPAPAGIPLYPLYDLLFFTKGDVSINAAAPGQQTSYIKFERGSRGGGLFTRAFYTQSVDGGSRNDWKQFFLDV